MHISTLTNSVPWLGSKFSILPWLLPLLPKSYSWVELFGGSGVVTLNREPSSIETINDINKDIVHFMKILRDEPEKLITGLFLTPHSRTEYDDAWFSGNDDPVERARKFYIRMRQSFLATGSQVQKKGWVSATRQTRCKISEATNKYLKSVDNLWEIVDRLKRIQIENRDWSEVLANYDTKDTLFYADPPYDRAKRSSGSDYLHEFTDDDHVKLRDQLAGIQGKWAVSGYDSFFMLDLYRDYQMITGPVRKNNRSNRSVREVLFVNYDPYRINPQLQF